MTRSIRSSLVIAVIVAGMVAGCNKSSGGGKKPPPPGNQPPTLTAISTPQSVVQSMTLNIASMATDPNLDPLTMTATPPLTNSTFVDNGNGTGDFSFTPDSTQVGMSFSVTFGANDGTNPAVTQNVDIMVTMATNLPPTLNPIPSPVSVLPLSALVLPIMATDPELDPITLTALPLPPEGVLAAGRLCDARFGRVRSRPMRSLVIDAAATGRELTRCGGRGAPMLFFGPPLIRIISRRGGPLGEDHWQPTDCTISQG